MTLTGDRGNHPEATYPKSPETADGTSSVGGPPAHFDTLARLLSVNPELVPAALANLIASERESAVSEFRGRAEALADEWGDATVKGECPDGLCGACTLGIASQRLYAIVRDLANTT